MGWLLDKLGIAVIATAFALSAPLIVFIGSAHITDAVLMAAVFLIGLGMLGGQVGLNAISGTIYPTYIRSTGAGWALGVGRIGSILGPVIGGVLIGWGSNQPRHFLSTRRYRFSTAGALLIRFSEEFIGSASRGPRQRKKLARIPRASDK